MASSKMDISLEEKRKEVHDWLMGLYREEQIPPYEKNETSIDILFKLMKVNRKAEANALLKIKDCKRKVAEYTAEAEQVKSWYEPLGLSPDLLSTESRDELTALVQTMEILGTNVPTSANLLLAVNAMQTEHDQVKEDLKREDKHLLYLMEVAEVFSQKIQEIQGLLKMSEDMKSKHETEVAHAANQNVFLEKKSNEYLADIELAETSWKQLGITEEIFHGHLQQKWKELKELEIKVKSMEEELTSYALPPDLALARLKVAEVEAELAQLLEQVKVDVNAGQV